MASYLLSKTAAQIDTVISDYYSKYTGNRFVLTTGAQTISGNKTFSATSFSVSAASINITGNNNIFGDNAVSNNFGQIAQVNIFGDSAPDYNSFGSNAFNNYFGDSSLGANSFGGSAAYNTYGTYATSNIFGDSCAYNLIGDSSIEAGANLFGCFIGAFSPLTAHTNKFGVENKISDPFSYMSSEYGNNFGGDSFQNTFGCYFNNVSGNYKTNWFGISSNYFNEISYGTFNCFGGVDPLSLNVIQGVYDTGINNYFGTYSNVNEFGSNSKENRFGIDAYTNSYGSGSFAGPVSLRLRNFTGSKTQSGNTGDLRVSGTYLYICTGTNTWGRTLISTF